MITKLQRKIEKKNVLKDLEMERKKMEEQKAVAYANFSSEDQVPAAVRDFFENSEKRIDDMKARVVAW